jgi:hypothetical protein
VQFSTPIAVARRTVTGRDALNNDVYGEVATVVLGAFAPGPSSEVVQGQDTVVTQPTVYLPTGTAVDAVDVIVVDPVLDTSGAATYDARGRVVGDRYSVDGTPLTWSSPFSSWAPGVEVRLRKVTG